MWSMLFAGLAGFALGQVSTVFIFMALEAATEGESDDT
jgi:hypothetical protein